MSNHGGQLQGLSAVRKVQKKDYYFLFTRGKHKSKPISERCQRGLAGISELGKMPGKMGKIQEAMLRSAKMAQLREQLNRWLSAENGGRQKVRNCHAATYSVSLALFASV
eukprot:1158377-Pelagomonas_calceolata.AAC.3